MPISLTLPVDEQTVRSLHVGDEVLFSGRMITARDGAHRHLVRAVDPVVKRLVEGRFIYHCGPVVAQDPATHAWRFVAAGPGTSMREEPYQAEVIARYGVRGVVGKGGMGPATLAALAAHGAVYLHAVGALAVGLARRVVRVHGVHLLDELGVREAIWDIEVKDFPAIVTMDAHGESLHAKLEGEAEAARALLERTSLRLGSSPRFRPQTSGVRHQGYGEARLSALAHEPSSSNVPWGPRPEV